MPSMSATCSMAFCGTQPPACSCARHNSGMTAEACRPSGYFAIWPLAHFTFAAVKAKFVGWISAGARRRTAIIHSLDRAAALGLTAAQFDRAPNELIVFLQDELEKRTADLRLDHLITLCEIAGDGRLILRECRQCTERNSQCRGNEQLHRSTSPN